MLVRDRLMALALERSLRQSTVYSYERLLARMSLLDRDFETVTEADTIELLWTIDNVNTRRAAVICVRSVFGFSIKIPKGIPRVYDLPSEDTLRLALMTTPHEARGLLMMYAGLRVGEACAITFKDVAGDRLTVDKQVSQLHRTGEPTITRLAPVKTSEATVVIPHFMTDLVLSIKDTTRPDAVRESLRRAGKKVGISLNPHMLRHFYATTLLARGVPFALVSKQMRHSDITTTLRTYSQFSYQSIHDAFGS